MKKPRLILFLFFQIIACKSYSQDVKLSQPRLESEGNQLIIFYDIVTKNLTDQFYIWIEIKKSNGEIIQANSLSGDVGANVKAGSNKKIIWSPEQDSIYLDEDVSVEVKAEKYIKSFNKGSMMLKSTVFPGWGQAVISGEKLWWITGVTVYGALATGIIYHQKYLKTLDSYKAEVNDPVARADLLEQSQRQLNISTAMVYTAASAWAINILWITCTPNKYRPLQNTKLTVNPYSISYNTGLLFSLEMNF